MAPVTPMPHPLSNSSATPSPELARSSLEQEDVEEGNVRINKKAAKGGFDFYVTQTFSCAAGEADRESPLPENLSLPKKCSSRPPTAPHPYMTYHQQFQAFQQHHYQQHYQQQQQRSPVDILIRAFPNRRRSDVEAVLQRCKGSFRFF